MKNFFRKTSLCLVLALVCSLFHGMITAEAAQTVIVKQGGGKAPYYVYVDGGNVDYSLSKVYKSNKYVWDIKSGKEYATINSKTGVVTGIAPGYAVIRCTAIKPNGSKVEFIKKIRVLLRSDVISTNDGENAVLVKGGTYVLTTEATPSDATDVYRYTSSDSSVVTVNYKTGELRAIGEGTAVIDVIGKANVYTRADSKYNRTTSLTVTVVSNQASDDATLKKLLNTDGSGQIELAGKEETEITIPQGDYSEKTLIVNMPNADVTNNGTFKEIEIRDIKPTTYHENGKNNILRCTAPNASIIVAINSIVKGIIVDRGSNAAKIVVNGKTDYVVVNSKSKVELSSSESSGTEIPKVLVKAEDAVIKSSMSIELEISVKAEVVLEKGAEKTVIVNTAQNTVEVNLTNNTENTIEITNVDGNKEEVKSGEKAKVEMKAEPDKATDLQEVDKEFAEAADKEEPEVPEVPVTPEPEPEAIPTPQPTTAPPAPPAPTSTPTKSYTETVKASVSGNQATYKLPVGITSLDSATVQIDMDRDGTFETSYQIGSSVISKIGKLLNQESNYIALWKRVQDLTVSTPVDGKTISIHGTAGDLTKTVTFDGTSYTVTVNETEKNIELTRNAVTYVLSKTGNDTLNISGAVVDGTYECVQFVVTYTK